MYRSAGVRFCFTEALPFLTCSKRIAKYKTDAFGGVRGVLIPNRY
jgi:hypothetical protein